MKKELLQEVVATAVLFWCCISELLIEKFRNISLSKKSFSCLIGTALLLSSCDSSDKVATTQKGDLVAKISFYSVSTKSATSTAIPKTSWGNVKSIHLFLYNPSDGAVAFSDVIDPSTVTTTEKTFKWTNVPVGTYDLALVANVNSTEDNVATSLDGGSTWAALEPYNVIGKKVNSQLFIDLKKSAFPANHTFGNGDVAYAPSSEIFTAYKSNVAIQEGVTTDLSSGGLLTLAREISLLRVRIDKTDKVSAPNLSSVDFANANNFIAVHNLPVGLGLKLGSFLGGVYTNSDQSRILIGSEGATTYNSEDPSASDYEPTKIIDPSYTLWKDIRVWPNASRSEELASSADAKAARKYFIVISGWAPQGYTYADGSVASQAQPVYWYGTINGVFAPNVIREVNLSITSKGYPQNPDNPDTVGGLIIELGAPQNWETIIDTENHNL